MKVYIIGTGIECCETLTEEAKNAIEKSDIIIGARRMVERFSHLGAEQFISWKSSEILDYLRGKSFSTASVLVSGDCGFFSGAQQLISALSDYETELICGISTPVYFCSKIKKQWQDMKFISLHGAEGNVIRNICKNRLCFFLLGGNITPSEICKKLCSYGRGETDVYIGENLGYENERIFTGSAADFTELECGKLCVMITENPSPENGISFGIPDSEFIRDNVPMTKSEIRAAVVSKLNIGSSDICWDIGCGTGSVTVEMALQCYDGAVYAVDKNEAAVELTEKNARKFCCDNILTVCGTAPEKPTEFPAPDKVFIGGSSGKIGEILNAVYTKNPAADVVITAVSLETLNEGINAFLSFGIDVPEITQLAVTRTRKIGNHTMFSAENPIFILKGVKNEKNNYRRNT